ncbi:GNAT family N-acetyltransferase [Vulcaniibacterium tengchongense]|uniref:Acetyltransferase (GNAT) family protein n=1 Tax=Vulcaniibacterium tengchongense TaxID=1273429 RepID=A0A3N4VCH0_9GAMM|nr:GNAT family N-acetyltransferase [Vulcaniibacterium tengchongense]RPE74847.1 acetyltransferase (GNAT) family protein [Vulcaniibacterium tengchongense]
MSGQAHVDVRPCAPADAEALALVGRASFLGTFAGVLDGRDILAHCESRHAPEAYRRWPAGPGCAAWLAAAAPGGAAVGDLVLSPASLPLEDRREDDLEVKRVYLLHRFQGGGLGRRLMDAAVAHPRGAGSRRLRLGVRARNRAAIRFCQRFGNRAAGSRRFRAGDTAYEDTILAFDLQEHG